MSRETKRANERAIKRNGMSKYDWSVGLRVLSDTDYKAALLRRRNGTPANPGAPEVPGMAQRLADMTLQRMMPDFEEINTKEQVADFDRTIALFAAVVEEIDDQLANEKNLRRAFSMPDPPEDQPES